MSPSAGSVGSLKGKHEHLCHRVLRMSMCAHAYAYVKFIKTPLLRTVVGTVGTVVETAVETVAKTVGTVTFLLGLSNLTPFNRNLTVSM